MLIVMLVAVPSLALAFFMLYYMRSSKETPKNWRELIIEAKFQLHGAAGFIEDVFMRCFNKIGEFAARCDKSKNSFDRCNYQQQIL